jgi:HEAT repeat protein
MDTTRSLTRGLLLLAALTMLTAARAQAADDKEPALIKILQSDSPPADKAMACKELSIYGSPACVPELAKLLTNAELASWARIALEAIPGSASDEALRNAIPSLSGRLLTGTLNSIGVRRNAGAVDALSGKLQDRDEEVASAAAVALGCIGNAPATKALRQSLAGAPAPVRNAIAEGCVLCAERLMSAGQAVEAAAIYDQLRKADLPKQKVLEATRGSILARKAEGIPLLVEQLRSPDKVMFQLGLGTARELPGPEVAKALAAEFIGASPERASLMLLALADRHDTVMLPAVLEAAASGPKQVRLAAISVLPRLGDDSCVEPLLQIAIGDDKDLAEAAKTALASLPGESVDKNLLARTAFVQENVAPIMIELIGLRRIEAKDLLLTFANNPRPAVRSAAWMALGQTVSLQDLPILVTEVIAPKHPEDAQAAKQGLKAACIRMPEGDACAEQLAVAMASAPEATKSTLLEIIGSMGGAKALETLASAAKGSDPQLQDVATKSLGEWMNMDAAPVLLDIAKSPVGEKYQVRALRGYLRLARQFVKQDGIRVDMCQKAFAAAQRPAEQKLVLDTLTRSPTIAALRLAVKATEKPELKEDGTKVALAIAGKLGDKPGVKELVAKVQANK